ncbi:MAG: DNA (cytosine-5-)-methyltransferase [Flavonifractor plautii]
MFAGIGGFRAGLDRIGGFQCVGHCEIDKYADASYRAIHDIREEERYYPDARKIDPNDLPGFDLLCGGFPCQAFSNAGRRKGFEDARGTLFFEIARLAQARRPAYLLLENVPGLLTHDQGRRFLPSSRLMTGVPREWMVLNSHFRCPQSSGCSLSDILIPDAPEKYFLSSEQTEKLLYKSSAGRRDRESMTPEGPPVHRLPEVEEKE